MISYSINDSHSLQKQSMDKTLLELNTGRPIHLLGCNVQVKYGWIRAVAKEQHEAILFIRTGTRGKCFCSEGVRTTFISTACFHIIKRVLILNSLHLHRSYMKLFLFLKLRRKLAEPSLSVRIFCPLQQAKFAKPIVISYWNKQWLTYSFQFCYHGLGF